MTIQEKEPVMELETDWSGLVRKKMDEKYQNGILKFTLADGRPISLDIQLRPRGNMRKQVCHYPPIKIKVPNKQLESLGFGPQNEWKMVLQCRTGSAEAEWMVKEWMIYQLYECISPAALRTRLLRIKGRQEGKDKADLLAILIENERDLAARLGGKLVKQSVMSISSLDRDAYVKMCFFQYMIGNTDWSVANTHNLMFVALPRKSGFITVPYDFDYAGAIQTSYAVPHESLPIKAVGDRHFLGYQISQDEAQHAARYFLSKKEEILARCTAGGYLEEKPLKTFTKFITDFFATLQDERLIKRTFVTK